MQLAVVYSRSQIGINAPLISIETYLSRGLPGLSIVGLPAAAVKESKDRVKSAILNSGFDFPARKIIINLAPANLPKEGAGFDLPIAIGILAATKQISTEFLCQYEFIGELALSGKLRCVPGIIPIAIASNKAKRSLFVPLENASSASMLKNNTVYAATSLKEVTKHITQEKKLTAYKNSTPLFYNNNNSNLDFNEIKGQLTAKRVFEIAASGGHNVLMIGPPGTGKTMLASRMPTILPELTLDEKIEIAAIYSVNRSYSKNYDKLFSFKPFRAPHHTSSSAALVGGGSKPTPGEISLAHNGVLFLDELPEFNKKVIESLREPLESGNITISRAAAQIEYPAKFQLIAAMNPCPCGNYNNPDTECRCSLEQVQRYQSKISGPFLDRIDLQIVVSKLPYNKLMSNSTYLESSNTIRDRVTKSSNLQIERQKCVNARLSNKQINLYCQLDNSSEKFLQIAIEKLQLSARGYQSILRVARTIADLANTKDILKEHLAEALQYRKKLMCNKLF